MQSDLRSALVNTFYNNKVAIIAELDKAVACTVLEQVAFVASAQLPLDYAMRGPRLLDILPHIRKLVTDE
ncbi:hypothetical protein SCUCBS95973_001010 [Sporothrix curviconia]|uniref:Uncharacterized protein n=1 Tax=Sporothrix curviconia TaxID=1260050 RepID=A0ABP0AV24_9PEZI